MLLGFVIVGCLHELTMLKIGLPCEVGGFCIIGGNEMQRRMSMTGDNSNGAVIRGYENIE